MSRLPEPEVSVKDKLYNLYNELVDAKKDKKATVKAHSENIKRIEDELKELLDEEEEGIKASQQTTD